MAKNCIKLSKVLEHGIDINTHDKKRTLVIKSTEKNAENQEINNIYVYLITENVEICCSLFNLFDQKNFIFISFDNISKKIIEQILKKSFIVRINNKEFEFKYFGQSPSQLRKKACVLYNINLGKREALLNEFGNFDKISTDIAKYTTRAGLLLSKFNKALELNEENIDYSLKDIERNGFNFTDGCGLISLPLLIKIAELKNISAYYRHQQFKCPSVIQIRINSCKGVLAAYNTDMNERKIWLRKSLVKFEWTKKEPYILGICDDGISRPYTYAYLNKQFICILSANGIENQVFIDKQKRYFEEMEVLLNRMDIALRYLYFWNRYDLAERLMSLKSLDNDDEIKSFLKEKRKKFLTDQFKEGYKNDASGEKTLILEGLKIPIEKSRNVFGIADANGCLNSDECFFQVTMSGKTKILHDVNVVVLKCPSYHPGDIKVLKCVDKKELRHLYDCIVFSVNGNRPPSDEIAGSDLDGDKYFVSWDEDIVPLITHTPTSYLGAKSSNKINVSDDSLIKYFAYYDNSLVGEINNLWCKWADLEGVLSPKCLFLANLFSRAVDAAKTGESLRVPSEFKNIPVKDVVDIRFIWQIMSYNAKYYLKESFKRTENEFKLIDDDTLYELIEQKYLIIDDYYLFRSLYKYLFNNSNENKKKLFYKLANFIQYDYFNSQQINDVMIDCPGLSRDFFLCSLMRSKILPKKFAEYIQLDSRRIKWSLYYSNENTLNWFILNDFLLSKCNKLLVFEFNTYDNIKRTLAVFINYSINVDTCTDHIEGSTATAYLCIGNSAEMHRKLIDSKFTWSLTKTRLQLFINEKSRTFINFMYNDENDQFESIMSVALEYFDVSLPRRLPKLRRERCVRVELYSDLGSMIEPFYDTCLKQKNVNSKDSNTKSEEENLDFYLNDFPDISRSRDIATIVKLTRRELFDELKAKIVKKLNNNEIICDDMESLLKLFDKKSFISYEIMNFVIYSLSRGGFFTNADSYKEYIIDLIKIAPNSTEFVKNWIEKCLIVFENMMVNNKLFNIDHVDYIINEIIFNPTCRKLFPNDLLKLIKLNKLPMTRDISEINIEYFCYWSSLLSMNLIVDIEELEYIAKQSDTFAKGNIFVSDNETEKEIFLLNLIDSTLILNTKDTIAFTPIMDNLDQYTSYSPMAFGQVMKNKGLIYEFYFVWSTKDFDVKRFLNWRIDRFVSLIPFRRQIDALKLACMENNVTPLCKYIIESWYETSKAINEESVYDVLEYKLNKLKLALNDKNCVNEIKYLKEANDAQKQAILNSKNNAISLVHGPPGTGKTEVACEIIRQWNSEDANNNVLVVAETNEAVNNIMLKLLSKGFKSESIIRLGFNEKLDSNDLSIFTLENIYSKRYGHKSMSEFGMDKKKVSSLMNKYRIVFTTCSSTMLNCLNEIKFKYLLVDEASQAFEATLIMPLLHGCEVMCLIGDHKQLPPLVKNEKIKEELEKTLFERLFKLKFIKNVMLNIQYRMNPDIASFISKEFYNDNLLNDSITLAQREAIKIFDEEKTLIKKSIYFINVTNGLESKFESSKQNTHEAQLIKQLINNLKLNNKKIKDEDIGILTAYSGQVRLLNEVLKDFKVTINTVDGFQGQEKDVIFYSCVRSNKYNDVGFLNDERRFNVAMTRAKRLLLVIGNKKTLEKDRLWSKWMIFHSF